MTVETVIEAPEWAVLDLPSLAERAVAATLGHLRLKPGDWEVALLACDDARIAALNTEFRQKPVPTNVLSWPSDDRAPQTAGAMPAPPDPDEPELGDLAIAFETCRSEAEAAGLALADHVTHLLVHGTLHLLGFDHERDEDGDLMERLETEILAALGIADPYGAHIEGDAGAPHG